MTEKKKESTAKAKKIPRQKSLPGMGDAKIAVIENLALDYAEIRDQRVSLTAREVAVKEKLIKKMHRLRKTEYRRNGIRVTLTVEKEGIKVRVKEEGPLETKEEAPATVEVGEEGGTPF